GGKRSGIVRPPFATSSKTQPTSGLPSRPRTATRSPGSSCSATSGGTPRRSSAGPPRTRSGTGVTGRSFALTVTVADLLLPSGPMTRGGRPPRTGASTTPSLAGGGGAPDEEPPPPGRASVAAEAFEKLL